MPCIERKKVVKKQLCGCFSMKKNQSPVGPKKKGKGGGKKEDLFVVIALKARISKVKTTDLQACLYIWG